MSCVPSVYISRSVLAYFFACLAERESAPPQGDYRAARESDLCVRVQSEPGACGCEPEVAVERAKERGEDVK